jgi:hypothetical protein
VLAELLLPILGLAALSQRGAQGVLRDRAFLSLFGALLLTLAGYVASDLAAQSSAEQYLRGWGRTALVLTDFVALALLIGAQRQTLWWFAFGMGLGRMLSLRLLMHEPLAMWKFAHDYTFGYAEPVTLVVIALGSFLRPRTTALMLAGVGLYSIRWDFRIQSAVCIVLAVVLWMRAGRAAGRVRRAAMARLAIAAGVVAIVLWGALQLTSDSTLEQRREVSDIGRSFGKVFALKAIVNSPLLGYGSWSSNPDFLRLQKEALAEVAGANADRYAQTISDRSSVVHSMLLQAWVEGGLLGTAFFFVLCAMLLRRLRWLLLARQLDPLYPYLLYFSLYGLWHSVMSAFAAPLRLQIALAAAAVVCLALEQRAWRTGPASDVPSLRPLGHRWRFRATR